MRQLLITLGDSLKWLPEAQKDSLVNQTLFNAYNIAFKEREALKSKPALQVLELFLSKGIVPLPCLLGSFQHWAAVNFDASLQNQGQKRIAELLMFACLLLLSNADKASSAAHLMRTICEQASVMTHQDEMTNDTNGEVPLWAKPIIAVVRRSSDITPQLQNFVFPTLFKHSPLHVASFLNLLQVKADLGFDNNSIDLPKNESLKIEIGNQASLFYATLQTAKEIGAVQEIDSRQSCDIRINHGCIGIPDVCIGGLMSNDSARERLAGFSLLVSSASGTHAFTRTALKSLRNYLPNFHVDPDPNFRGDMHSLTQRLIDRLRAVTSVLNRKCSSGLSPEPSLHNHRGTYARPSTVESRSLQAHYDFIHWYRKFLVQDLRPTAPYQRRICSLKALLILLRSGLDPSVAVENLSKQAKREIKWPIHVRIMDQNLTQLLLNLLLDPFDDIRFSAAAILSTVPIYVIRQERYLKLDDLRKFLAHAEMLMLSSGRADHADGVARTHALLFTHPDLVSSSESDEARGGVTTGHISRLQILEHLIEYIQESIDIAKTDLSRAVEAHPMHGALTGLR